MRLAIEVTPAEIAVHIDQMLGVAPFELWEKRFTDLIRFGTEVGDPLLLVEEHELEFAIFALLAYHQKNHLVPMPRNPEEQAACEFIATFSQAYRSLSPAGQKRFGGPLQSGLKTDIGLAPLAFELSTATHLCTRGFEIEFHDLERNVGGFDLLATKGGSAEIECKWLGTDTGRQVHRSSFGF